MDMFKDFKEDRNESINEFCENTIKQWNEVMKTVQDMKMETELLRKTKTGLKLEMKNLESYFGWKQRKEKQPWLQAQKIFSMKL